MLTDYVLHNFFIKIK